MDITGLIIDFLFLVLSFGAMHIISERFFIASLDHISKKLRMSSDMAGSTLMAAGSSAPELAVALFAIFMSGHHEAIGIGTIVGSALFNILVITGVVMFIRRRAKLVWQPIIRDVGFYILAIALLAYTFHYGEVSLLHGALMLGAYLVYLLVVYFWKRLIPYADTEEIDENDLNPQHSKRSRLNSMLDSMQAFAGRYQFVVFFLSVALISLLSWVLVNKAVSISETLGIPEFLIGITIVAVGTSIPDLISSAIVARQGRPGMAINNAIGSNTFDILIGLGLPFLLYSLIFGRGFALSSDGLLFSVSALMGSALLLILYFYLAKWKTSRSFGLLLILFYLIYLVYISCTVSC